MRPKPCTNCGALYRPDAGHTCMSREPFRLREQVVIAAVWLAACCASAGVACGVAWAVGAWR